MTRMVISDFNYPTVLTFIIKLKAVKIHKCFIITRLVERKNNSSTIIVPATAITERLEITDCKT